MGGPLNLASAKRSVIGTVGLLAKGFLNGFCKTHSYNKERLFKTVLERSDRPLITVANHSSVLDDPGMWGILPFSILTHKKRMRWSLGAKEICFSTSLTAWFFASGRVIPIVRGDGIYQPAMNLAVEKLNDNGWVHIFSEGRVNQDSTMLPFRWGIARLIMESKVPPIVLPFWHKGLETVMPEDTKYYYPRPCKEVVLSFGKPIDFAENGVLEQIKGMDEAAARILITDYIFKHTVAVQKETEKWMGDPDWRVRGRPQQDVDHPPRRGDPS
ncbi:Tafazzin [Powellomyces hirtus]|nr:Tafazzin [Powellomyces hirtus]